MLIKANYYSLSPRRFIAGTKNSYGIEKLGFEFSPEWDGLAKKVTFYPEKGEPVSVIYGDEPVKIPAEVMAHAGLATFTLSGHKNGAALISVTGYIDILDSKLPSDNAPVEPTPDEMSQVLSLMQKAVDTAESVRRDADLGLFKGEKGDPGSVANISQIVTEVKNALPESDTDETNALANTVEFEPVLISNFITNGHYFPYGATVPTAEGTVSFIKIPCRGNEVYRVSFKGAVGAGTPCFIQDSDCRGIKTIIGTDKDLEKDNEKVFCVPKNGAYIVFNYVSTLGIPHIYRYPAADPTVWGLPSYWFGQLELTKSAVDMCQNQGKNTFTFAFLSDTHLALNQGGGFARLMKYVLDSCDIPVFLHGGDIVEGAGGSTKQKLISEIKHHKEIFGSIEDKGLFALGNHDASYGITGNYDGVLSDGEIYNYLFRSNEEKSGIVSGDTGRYFYKDNTVQKVRYIVLDSFALSKNPMINDAQFGCDQLLWLADALNVPEDYSIVLCSHIAPYRRFDLDSIGWTGENVAVDAHIALSLVNAYRNKTSFTCSEAINGEDYSIFADFSGKKGYVVCWIAGHSHKDYIFDINGLKIVCTANCSSHVSVNPPGFAPEKEGGTPKEFAFDIVCVNKATRSVSLIRLGSYINYEEGFLNMRSFNYKDIPLSGGGGEEGGDSGNTEPVVKTFTLEGFGDHTSTDNGDNTFNFNEGMTWKEWKASSYNSWDHSNYGEFKFETYHNGTVSIDVGCNPDTPIEGVCNADGTPVKDSEVIQAITYLYVDDLDWYGCEEDSGDSGNSGGSGETHTAYMETCYANGVGSYTFEFTDGQTVGDIFEDVCCPACGQHLDGVTEDTVLEPDGHYYCPNY